MAEPNTNDVRTATNASNTTRYFHLPLFIATDKPSWLVDWNGAMGDIDNILQDIATASEGAVADVATIQTQIDALNQTIPNLEALVNTAVSDVAAMQTTVASHETRMDAIETDLITQNNLIKTLSDAVTAMQATVATLNNRVQACEDLVSGLDTNVTAISAELTQIRTQMTNISGQISSLDTRVTALEQGGGGGGGSTTPITDLAYYEAQFSKADFSSNTYTFTMPYDGYIMARVRLGAVTGANVGYASNTYFRRLTGVIKRGNEARGDLIVTSLCAVFPYGNPTQTTTPEADECSALVRLKENDTITFTLSGNMDTDLIIDGHLFLYH